ncbi:MAG TPA: hypothetical protein VHJ34_11495 [Actinomycetota bacterium]|nr:hypothetical protein [Actinomycetota bacterium]
MRRRRKSVAVVAVAAMVLSLSVVLAGEAVAHGSCFAYAHTPYKESGRVKSFGYISCGDSHVIDVTVRLQKRQSDGSWNNVDTASPSGFGTLVQGNVGVDCSNGTYRTVTTGTAGSHPSMRDESANNSITC